MQKVKPRVTLKDIADAVGVTKMTVSRYLREPETVSQKTRIKIAASIESLGYIKSRLPSALSKTGNKTIGMVMVNMPDEVSGRLIKGIEPELRANGYEILIKYCIDDESAEEAQVTSLLSYEVDAIMLTRSAHTARTRQLLKASGVPVVECLSLPDAPLDIAVGINHELAAFEAVYQLVNAGCTDIVCLAHTTEALTQRCVNGYRRAIKQAGLPEMIIESTSDTPFSAGRDMLNDALAQFETIDGLFCTHDNIAAGAFLCAQEYGLEIPDDLRVIGYHHLDIGQVLAPALTSVSTFAQQVGKKSAQLLLARLHNETVNELTVELDFNIESGGSV
ncbi:LacI family DNA-binding transcriptional regulator [Alteromonas lipotrueiana]|uniref:LacI family DNA-binding transcriptional regulator n=1 Tax=Alteromonas lipotrueiana TaxID=2803815 RepID=UPI001C46F139|nr:LacI family DNA-binding transcriptional regulator [Alteromonas lipotrueiana]